MSEFIELVAEVAVKDWRKRRIMLPSVVIAQAILESGWGTKELAVSANALFGIKENGWTGKTYVKAASEQRADGTYYVVNDTEWRAYENWEESILDHNDYIATREISDGVLRYQAIIGNTDVKAVCELLQSCGYATSLTYPEKLLDLIHQYNLTQYDITEVVKMAVKKVFIGVGHGGSDAGAVKYLVEKDINLKMALACRDYLEKAGVLVLMSRTTDENDTLTDEVNECNAFNPDVAIDIHNNAGGGDGFEVFHTIYGGVGRELAANVEKEVISIGQNSRGIKTRKNSSGTDYYGFIRLTACPAIIVEGVFVDHATDYLAADTDKECEAFGIAYAKGILKTLGVKLPEENATVYHRVQVGAFIAREKAENLANKLITQGYEAVVVSG